MENDNFNNQVCQEDLKSAQDVIQASVDRTGRFDLAQWAVIYEK